MQRLETRAVRTHDAQEPSRANGSSPRRPRGNLEAKVAYGDLFAFFLQEQVASWCSNRSPIIRRDFVQLSLPASLRVGDRPTLDETVGAAERCRYQKSRHTGPRVRPWAGPRINSGRCPWRKWVPACELVKKISIGWISAVRPSRRPLRGLPRMRSFLNAIKGSPHAEEHPEGASRSTRDRAAANFFTASFAGKTRVFRANHLNFLRREVAFSCQRSKAISNMLGVARALRRAQRSDLASRFGPIGNSFAVVRDQMWRPRSSLLVWRSPASQRASSLCASARRIASISATSSGSWVNSTINPSGDWT
jgi:hypothetical protein